MIIKLDNTSSTKLQHLNWPPVVSNIKEIWACYCIILDRKCYECHPNIFVLFILPYVVHHAFVMIFDSKNKGVCRWESSDWLSLVL